MGTRFSQQHVRPYLVRLVVYTREGYDRSITEATAAVVTHVLGSPLQTIVYCWNKFFQQVIMKARTAHLPRRDAVD